MFEAQCRARRADAAQHAADKARTGGPTDRRGPGAKAHALLRKHGRAQALRRMTVEFNWNEYANFG
jgi:hypothetical protein